MLVEISKTKIHPTLDARFTHCTYISFGSRGNFSEALALASFLRTKAGVCIVTNGVKRPDGGSLGKEEKKNARVCTRL
jgi:hypothetical protein